MDATKSGSPSHGRSALISLTLTAVGVVYVAVWARHLRGRLARPKALELAVGFVTNFFDTLGIGSYAPTTALFRFFRLVPDERIPGTLNVGHTLPTVAQAIIYIQIVQVEVFTLVAMIVASGAGAWLGAGIVSKMPRRRVQIGMGSALLAAASIMLLQLLGLMPGGGDALALSGVKLGVGLAGNFVLGALMTLGIGLYAHRNRAPDPPRTGARSLAEMLARSQVPRIVAVSCNPATLARDLRILADGGYRIRSVVPIDQFAWSAHVEAVAVLDRRAD